MVDKHLPKILNSILEVSQEEFWPPFFSHQQTGRRRGTSRMSIRPCSTTSKSAIYTMLWHTLMHDQILPNMLVDVVVWVVPPKQEITRDDLLLITPPSRKMVQTSIGWCPKPRLCPTSVRFRQCGWTCKKSIWDIRSAIIIIVIKNIFPVTSRVIWSRPHVSAVLRSRDMPRRSLAKRMEECQRGILRSLSDWLILSSLVICPLIGQSFGYSFYIWDSQESHLHIAVGI